MTATIHSLRHIDPASGCEITAPRPGRARLHLLDLDNLHGSPHPGIGRIDRVRSDYEAIDIGPIDLVYGACNHDPTGTDRLAACRLYHLCQTWGQAMIRPAHGPDGADNALIADAAHLLMDQARIIEGEAVADANAFSRRLSAVMENGLKT